MITAWQQMHLISQVLAILWLAGMITVPIWKWIIGPKAERAAISAGVLLQAGLVISILMPAWGLTRTLLVWLAVSGLGWLSELIGSRTGFPYGPYTYTKELQPQLLRVPVVVPLAWMMMMPPAWAAGDAMGAFFGMHGTIWALAVFGAIAFTSWHLFLDPQMVAWDFWRWHRKGRYFGIPLVNYAGWLAVAALITLVVQPADLPMMPLLMVFTLTWLLQSIAQIFFWKLRGPGLVGFLVMGACSLLAWLGATLINPK